MKNSIHSKIEIFTKQPFFFMLLALLISAIIADPVYVMDGTTLRITGDGVITEGAIKMISPEKNYSAVVIDGQINCIGEKAFQLSTSLTSVSINAPIATINAKSFYSCKVLESFIIPDETTTIGADAFSNCDAMISVTYANKLVVIGKYAFYSCQALQTFTLRSGEATTQQTIIHEYAFSNCIELTQIDIFPTLSCIANNTFEECNKISISQIPETVT